MNSTGIIFQLKLEQCKLNYAAAMLQEGFLKPLHLTPYRSAKDIDILAVRVYCIVSDKRVVTAETDLLLCKYFGLSDDWWLAAQPHHDTHVVWRKPGKRLDAILPSPLLDVATAN